MREAPFRAMATLPAFVAALSVSVVGQGTRPLAYTVHTVRSTIHSSSGPVSEDVILEGHRARIDYPNDPERYPTGRFELWLDDGGRRLVVDPDAKTYYDVVLRAKNRASKPSPTLSVLEALPSTKARSVSKVKVDVRADPEPVQVAGFSCVHIVLQVSYRLDLAMESLPDTRFPATVRGTAAFDVAHSLPVPRLPFDHGAVAFVTGFEEVDRSIAERLASIPGASGVSVRTVLEASRQVESSPVSDERKEISLDGFRNVTVAAGTFELPAGLRYQEPVLVGPTRIVK